MSAPSRERVLGWVAGLKPAPAVSRRLVAGVQVPSAVEGFPRAASKCRVLQDESPVSPGPSSFSLATVFTRESIFECPVWLLGGVSWRATAGSACVSCLYSLFFCFMRLSLRVILILQVVSRS